MWIPAAIRKGIGTDYDTYVDYIRQVADGLSIRKTEIGFNAVIKFIVYFHLDTQWFFVITSFLTVLFLFLSIKKYFSLSILFYNLLLLDLYSYNIVRQGLAVTIIMYAVSYLIDGQKFKYVIFVLLAASFHSMSIICLPFVFLCKLNYKVIITGGIIVLLFLPSVDIVSLISKIPVIGDKYGRYFFNNFYGVEQDTSLIGLIARFIPGLLIILFSRNILEKEPQYGVIVIMVLAYLCSIILLSKIFIFYRMVEFFVFSLVFMMPKFFESIRKSNVFKFTRETDIFKATVRYAVIIGIIFITLVSYERYVTRDQSAIFGSKNVVPYTSIFH